MIVVRDDDVLLNSKQHPDPCLRFMTVHEAIKSRGFHHVPTLLCSDLNLWPAAVAFIKQEEETGHMTAQYHGMQHVDYALFSEVELLADYAQGQDWFVNNLGHKFTRHYTPWGAGAKWMTRGKLIRPTALSVNIEMIDCDGMLEPETIINDTDASWAKYDGREIFIHWWAGIGALIKALDKLNETRP
jgi:hypothetical protein